VGRDSSSLPQGYWDGMRLGPGFGADTGNIQGMPRTELGADVASMQDVAQDRGQVP
jgi:hypothetical protein